MNDIKNIICKVLAIMAYGIGEEADDGEIGIKGNYLDAYLLAIVLKEFIENGDIKITLRNDLKSKPNRIDYLKRLIKSVEKLDISKEED